MDRVDKQKSSAHDRLLAAASRLFYEKGIRAVGVNTIAAQAQVTKATLYAHFGSKDGLITEHLRAREQRWRCDLERFLAGHRDPASQLDAIFAAYRAWAIADDFRGCGFVNAAAELTDPTHPARAIINAHKHAIRFRLEDLAAAADCPQPSDTAEQWFLLLEGGMLTATLRREPAPLDRAHEMATRLLPTQRV
ncbi:MAG: helix-turn-helix domain containing protein [Salinisphaera sp.]|nr:helix-turn-helix domain containing protein [Salinisphaera sp.]